MMKAVIGMLAALLALAAPAAWADETCMSPYMAKIVGQEDYVYIWTLGMEGVGDGEDKLVTVDVNPDSDSYGQVIHSLSVGGRNEAHHSGLTDDRRYLWASGLDTSKIFIFDIHSKKGARGLSAIAIFKRNVWVARDRATRAYFEEATNNGGSYETNRGGAGKICKR